MFKKLAILTMVAFIAGLFVVPMVSAECDDQTPEDCQSRVSKHVREGNMRMGMNQKTHKRQKWVRIYLYEKDPVTWDIVASGAWGFLDYRPQGTEFRFLFVGKKLVPYSDYTLIYYPDDNPASWPRQGVICLGSGTADELGKVKIVGKGDPSNPYYTPPVDTGDLPASYDTNAGAKIWLVLSSDVDCMGQAMGGWNPTEYLFENTSITFIDTDD